MLFPGNPTADSSGVSQEKEIHVQLGAVHMLEQIPPLQGWDEQTAITQPVCQVITTPDMHKTSVSLVVATAPSYPPFLQRTHPRSHIRKPEWLPL